MLNFFAYFDVNFQLFYYIIPTFEKIVNNLLKK